MANGGVIKSGGERMYLDNAATSWPKPQSVYEAVDRYQRELGAPAGRSAYREATEVNQIVEGARRRLARLLGVPDANQVVFTSSGTDSLNLALHGLLREGDHVVTSVVEHNSVLRPLRMLEQAGRISLTVVGCSEDGLVDPADVRQAITSSTRLVALSHASNVTGAIQPAEEIGRITQERGVLFLLDAAQTIGHFDLNVDRLHIDLLAAPCHKGLLAPLGTGMLYIRSGLEIELNSFRQGGTGTRSDEDRQPELMPSKYEAGNLNVPGIVGLAAALDYLEEQGIAAIARHEQRLIGQLAAGLSEVAGVRLYTRSESAASLVSMTIEDYDPQEVAATLDAAYRIQVRASLHCAPLMHRALGTAARGGTVRFSVGPFNTPDQIEASVAAVSEIASTTLAH